MKAAMKQLLLISHLWLTRTVMILHHKLICMFQLLTLMTSIEWGFRSSLVLLVFKISLHSLLNVISGILNFDGAANKHPQYMTMGHSSRRLILFVVYWKSDFRIRWDHAYALNKTILVNCNFSRNIIIQIPKRIFIIHTVLLTSLVFIYMDTFFMVPDNRYQIHTYR